MGANITINHKKFMSLKTMKIFQGCDVQKYIKVDNMCLLCITWHRSISKKNTVRVPPYHGFFFFVEFKLYTRKN